MSESFFQPFNNEYNDGIDPSINGINNHDQYIPSELSSIPKMNIIYSMSQNMYDDKNRMTIDTEYNKQLLVLFISLMTMIGIVKMNEQTSFEITKSIGNQDTVTRTVFTKTRLDVNYDIQPVPLPPPTSVDFPLIGTPVTP